MLHHSQGESTKAFIRTLGTTPLTNSSLTDRPQWIIGPDLYAKARYCNFFMVGLQIMHDLGFACQEETFLVCKDGCERSVHEDICHTHAYTRGLWSSSVVFFLPLSTALAKWERLH